MRKEEKERIEKQREAEELCKKYHRDQGVAELYIMINKLSPYNQLQQNLDKLVQDLRSIHQSEFARMEKVIEEFREKRLWCIISPEVQMMEQEDREKSEEQ